MTLIAVNGDVIAVSVISPAILLVVGGFIAYLSKRQDYARQDAVSDKVAAAAKQAADAAELLLVKQGEQEARAAEQASLLLTQQLELTAKADEVAQRNEERQDRLEAQTIVAAEQAARAAALLVANNEAVAAQSTAIKAQLTTIEDGNKVIHGLVNSNLQTELEAKHAGALRELAGLRREKVLIAITGLPTVEIDTQIEGLIVELRGQELVLTERSQQTAKTAVLSAVTFPPPQPTSTLG